MAEGVDPQDADEQDAVEQEADEQEAGEPGRLEEAAGHKLGVGRRDRPRIFRDAADAATDNDVPYWAVLTLSGAIAALGLAMGSSAVVIGAMLVAPLLAPVMGLSMALSVGDARLALQVTAVVAGSTAAVVAVSALLTMALPFQAVTPEILSRTRPSTLDLAVAVFSGLVGGVVTVSRESRLSAAIPGVAVAVALIPPLAAAGFGIGSEGNGDIVFGSMLLYGANLAGIVLSGMAVFMVVGMHRADVVRAARAWHEEPRTNGIARLVCRVPGLQRLGVFGSAGGRAAMVLAFAAALAIPLTSTLRQMGREVRVRQAVTDAESLLRDPGRTSVLGSTLTFGDDATRVNLRIATAVWVDEAKRQEFERQASEAAGEPVRLVLEQLPATAGGVEDLAGILPGRSPSAGPRAMEPLVDLLERSRSLITRSVAELPMPDGARPAGAGLLFHTGDEATLEVAYLATEPLDRQAVSILARSLRSSLGAPELDVTFTHLGVGALRLDPAGDATAVDSIRSLLRRYRGLRLELLAGTTVDSAAVAATLRALGPSQPDDGRIALIAVPGDSVVVRLLGMRPDNEEE